MVPGPAETYPEDLLTMARPLLPHYGKEFLDVWHGVRNSLEVIFGTAGEIIMIPGAGTAGTEMSLCGFAGAKCIVVRAGTFSDRLAEILQAHRATVINIDVLERQAASPEIVAKTLQKHADAAGVFMVHSETSTGILHPVEEIAPVVRKSGALLVVDAVSSLGSVDFQMDRWGIDICWSASQKALGCPPGLAMVAINDRALKYLAGNANKITSWYLNPLVWKWHADNWEWHPYPTSLPTPVFVAMNKALKRLVLKGLECHYERQGRAAAMIRKGCVAMGFEVYCESEGFASPTITALITPQGLDEELLRNTVLADHDIMIAGGFGKLRGQVIRIGHMGPGIEDSYILATLNAIEAAVRKQGMDVAKGSAITAALGS